MNWIETTSAVAVGHAASRYVGRIMQLIGLTILVLVLVYAFGGTGPSVTRLEQDRAWCAGYLSAIYATQSNVAFLQRSGAMERLAPKDAARMEQLLALQSPRPAGAGKVMIEVDGDRVFCDDPGWGFK